MKRKVLLWLDDVREPYGHHLLWQKLDVVDVVWVKTVAEFITYIQDNELPYAVSFDHDLLSIHYPPEKVYTDFISSVYWHKDKQIENTGLAAAIFLIRFCQNNHLRFPLWQVHSWNDYGKVLIESTISWYEKNKLI